MSSMVIILSLGLMKAERAFNVVVFPELVPPDIIAFADLTPSPSMHNQKNAASSIEIVFEFIKSIIVKGSFLNLRIVSDGHYSLGVVISDGCHQEKSNRKD